MLGSVCLVVVYRPGKQGGGVWVKAGGVWRQRVRPGVSGEGGRRCQRRAHIGTNVSVRERLVRGIGERLVWSRQNGCPGLGLDSRGLHEGTWCLTPCHARGGDRVRVRDTWVYLDRHEGIYALARLIWARVRVAPCDDRNLLRSRNTADT